MHKFNVPVLHSHLSMMRDVLFGTYINNGISSPILQLIVSRNLESVTVADNVFV